MLRHPTVPSLLLESGFISNPGEERLLDDADFQAQAAFAIAAGIENFLAPPLGIRASGGIAPSPGKPQPSLGSGPGTPSSLVARAP